KCRLDRQGGLALEAPDGDVAVRQQRLGVGVPLLLRELDGWGRVSLGDDFETRSVQLHAAGRLAVLHDGSGHTHAALVQRQPLTLEHALSHTTAVPYDEEADAAEVTAREHPADQRDALADVPAEVAYQRPTRHGPARHGRLIGTCGSLARHRSSVT